MTTTVARTHKQRPHMSRHFENKKYGAKILWSENKPSENNPPPPPPPPPPKKEGVGGSASKTENT